jgi:hypothetical protein
MSSPSQWWGLLAIVRAGGRVFGVEQIEVVDLGVAPFGGTGAARQHSQPNLVHDFLDLEDELRAPIVGAIPGAPGQRAPDFHFALGALAVFTFGWRVFPPTTRG